MAIFLAAFFWFSPGVFQWGTSLRTLIFFSHASSRENELGGTALFVNALACRGNADGTIQQAELPKSVFNRLTASDEG